MLVVLHLQVSMAMSHRISETPTGLVDRLERERIHFNKIAERDLSRDLEMPIWNIRRYDKPAESTPFPLEYAFHLLGELRGTTVVDLGCGEGLNTVILASLGARVLSVDISDKSLELTGKRALANGVRENVTLVHSDAATIPIQDGTADRVLCAAILHHVDCLATAQQIRRILKPGGIAVFLEPIEGPSWLSSLKSFVPKQADVTDDEQPLTMQQVRDVSVAVGAEGRSRPFLVITRLLQRVHVRSFDVIKASHQLDAALMRYGVLPRSLASPLVWEARKNK